MSKTSAIATDSLFDKLKPDYIHQRAAQGHPVPVAYADITKARLYFSGRNFGHPELDMMVRHYTDHQTCYSVWLGLNRGTLCAMRNANDQTPVYNHDLVDRA